MECIVCNKPIGKKARTCGSTCRSKLARSVANQPSVASSVAGSELWPKYRWSNESGYVMTDFELEHYKPAHELETGEHNPVSLPGDSHYSGVCLAAKYDSRRKSGKVCAGSECPTE